MTLRTQIALGAAPIALACTVAGCGGGGTKPAARPANRNLASISVASEKAQIKRTWSEFFAGSTPAAKKIQLLENGRRFAPVIEAQAKSPLAQQTKATVTRVTLEGPTRAKVEYTIWLAGQPALKNQTGTAVRVGGSWKVSDRSFCALLSLQGTAPPACRGA